MVHLEKIFLWKLSWWNTRCQSSRHSRYRRNAISNTWRAIFFSQHPVNQFHPLSYVAYWISYHIVGQLLFPNTTQRMTSSSVASLGTCSPLYTWTWSHHSSLPVVPLLTASEFLESLSCMTRNNNSAPALKVLKRLMFSPEGNL